MKTLVSQLRTDGFSIVTNNSDSEFSKDMKFTLIRTDQKNVMHLSMKTVEDLVERIKNDTKNGDVAGLRRHLMMNGRELRYERMHRLPMVYPSAELTRDANGHLVMQRMNGVLLLTFREIRGEEQQLRIKQTAMTMPSTLATFTGSSGESVKVLVSVSRQDGSLPETEDEANRLLSTAFAIVKAPYQALLGVEAEDSVPTVTTGFRMTHDPKPMLNLQASPFVISENITALSVTSTVGEQRQQDYDLYAHYENMYQQSAGKVWQQVGNEGDAEGVLAELARQLCLMGVPEEEAVTHIWAHYRYRKSPSFSEDHVRAVVGAVYAEVKNNHQTTIGNKVGLETRQLIGYLQSRYVFRYNTVMGYTEYRPNNTGFQDWQPVDERVVNGITTDARLTGINVWDRDIRRFIKSDKVHLYNPIDDYLWQVRDKWDGQDHIARLAATVPTTNPYWPQWFRTWMLAMVAQWRGQNRRYGNSVVPLLISRQGYNKSTFCRSLIPDELQWGYTDNLSLDEKRPVLQAMSQMLLINLDEFNQISARTQEGFLKNIIQLAQVKAKRPYGKHIEDFPRLASFIATTNVADVLSDASGNRRFIAVELTGAIDVSVRPNHEQIYAQAQALIDRGDPYWFDEAATRQVMLYNRQFQMKSPMEQYFYMLFEPAANTEDGLWMSAAAIHQHIKKIAGSAIKDNIIGFGRVLSNIDGLMHRRTMTGTEYLVKKK